MEDHGVIHNLMHNPDTLEKISFKKTQNMSEWWDNGVLPLWITAQNQVLTKQHHNTFNRHSNSQLQNTLSVLSMLSC